LYLQLLLLLLLLLPLLALLVIHARHCRNSRLSESDCVSLGTTAPVPFPVVAPSLLHKIFKQVSCTPLRLYTVVQQTSPFLGERYYVLTGMIEGKRTIKVDK